MLGALGPLRNPRLRAERTGRHSLAWNEPMPHSSLTVLVWPIGACVLLGAVAVYLLLPRPRRFPAWIGGLLGVVALVLAGIWLTHAGVSVESYLFYLFAGIAIIAGGMLVTQANP